MVGAGQGQGLRAVRAAVFAALCVVMSSTTHVLLSRTPLPLVVIAAMAAAVFAVAYALGGRERGYVSIATALIPMELAADTYFNAGQRTCYGPGGGPVTGSWRSLHEAIVCRGGDAGGPLAAHAGGPVGGLPVSPWLLLAAHVLVGLAAACLLRRGEAWLHRAARAAFRPLLVALAVLDATAPERPSRRPRHRAHARSPWPLLLHSLVRRGPPAPVAC